jgi:uncharacterized membrane protein
MAGLDSSITSIVGISGPDSNPADSSLSGNIAYTANVIIGILIVVAVFFIIKGAWEWMNTGSGDPKEARETVINAAVGIIVLVLAFFIVRLFVGGAVFLDKQF